MEQAEIEGLANAMVFAGRKKKPGLYETHISWVILTDLYAYKIKKPVKFSFLDFSTFEKRKYYCEKEVQLNKRLAGGMYIKVAPVFKDNGQFSLTSGGGQIVDYAVMMHRMDTTREMDKLLEKGGVNQADIQKLAELIAAFHKDALIVKTPFVPQQVQQRFADLETVAGIIGGCMGNSGRDLVGLAIERSENFLNKYSSVFEDRVSQGFIRDVHGDLHTGNIFLTEDPVVFDCIEFSDSLRQIDVLDEAAFLSMDLEAFGRADLADYFYQTYLQQFPAQESDESRLLFNYYKCYRANIRAKVSALKSKTGSRFARQVKYYMALVEKYLPV